MMTAPLLVQQTAQHTLTLTINRPAARNALDWQTQNLFLEAIQNARQNPQTRALIITGAGEKAFCAGGDLIELADYTTANDGERVTQVMGEALDLLEDAPFPTIAAINGHALGGGTEIALACDLRWIAPHAKFGMVQVKMGLTPGWGAGQRLLRTVGYARAMEILLSGKVYTSAEALEHGLVNGISDHPLATAQAFTTQIAAADREVVAAIKRVLRYGLTLPHDAAQQAEQQEFPPLWAADAHLQAVQAFLNRKSESTP